MGKEQFNLRLDEELIARVQLAAKEQGKSATQFTIEALNLFLGTPVQEQGLELLDQATDWCRGYIDKMLDEKLADIDRVLAEKLDYFAAKLVILANQIVEQRLRDHPSTAPATIAAANTPPADKPLSAKQLGIRLGYTDHSVVARNNRKMLTADFAEWTRSRDPEGIAWRYEDNKFNPQT